MKTWEIYLYDDLPKEKWRQATLCGNYMVSNLSRVKSIDRAIETRTNVFFLKKGRILKQRLDKDGYLCVKIRSEGVYPAQRVHILVAKAFIPNPENKPVVAHLDHDRANPALNNLQWATYLENTQQSVRDGRMQKGEERYCAILNKELVIKVYESTMAYREMAKQLKVSFSAIERIKSGKNWKHVTGGLIRNSKIYISLL